MVLVLVFCVVFCHGEVLPPPIALYRWWSSSMIGNKGKKIAYAYKKIVEVFE
jgi:hypothetical protein